MLLLLTIAVLCWLLSARAIWRAIENHWMDELLISERTYQRNRANERRKRVERTLKRVRTQAEQVQRNMIIRHGQVLEELEKAHRDLDELEHRYQVLAADVADLLPAHEERQILSLFNPPKE